MSLPRSADALYDQVAFDISVSDGNIGFSFTPDGNLSKGNPLNLYIAALIGTDIYFFNRNSQPFGLEKFSPNAEPSPFIVSSPDDGHPVPLTLAISDEGTPAPFDISTLNGIRFFAGSGSSVADFLVRGNLVQFYAGTVPTLPQPKRKWTVMVYMVGSTLESGQKNASKDILQMISGSMGLPENLVNIVVTTGGSKRNGWEHVKRSFIHGGQIDPIEDLGYDKETLNMGEPDVLSDFVAWGQENFQADHYALVLWGHGKGAEGGIGPDDNAKKRLDIPGLDAAFKTIEAANTRDGQKALDAVLYDACLMGTIEIAQITSQVTDIMGASADTEPGTGMDYEALLQGIETRNVETGRDFGTNAMEAYIHECDQNGKFQGSQTVVTYSVLDLSKLSDFITTMERVARELNATINESYYSYTDFSRALIRTVSYPRLGGAVRNHEGWQYSQDHYLSVDLVGFLENIGDVLPDLQEDTDALISHILGPEKSDGTGFQGGLVVAYRGNLDRIAGLDSKVGRLSINIGKRNDYIREDGPPEVRYLPSMYDDLNEAMITYFARRDNDMEGISTDKMCFNKTLMCADPNWRVFAESAAEELLSLSVWICRTASETGETDVLSIRNVYSGEPLNENLEYPVYKEDICSYWLCMGDRCEWITVSEYQGVLTAEGDVNGVPAIFTFAPDGENRWKVVDVMTYESEIWGRGKSLSFGDKVTPTQTRIIDSVAEKASTSNAMQIDEVATVYLKKTCNGEPPSVWISYFGYNGYGEFENVCDDFGLCFFDEEEGHDTHTGVLVRVD